MRIKRFNKLYDIVIFQLRVSYFSTFKFQSPSIYLVVQDSRSDIRRKSQRTLKLVSGQQLYYINIYTRVYFLLSKSFHIQSSEQYMLVIQGMQTKRAPEEEQKELFLSTHYMPTTLHINLTITLGMGIILYYRHKKHTEIKSLVQFHIAGTRQNQDSHLDTYKPKSYVLFSIM